MPFNSAQEVSTRLRQPDPLTREELASLFNWIPTLLQGDIRLLWAHLVVLTMQALDENREAIKDFDDSSKELTKRLLWLTWALVVLTVVIAFFTVLLWWRN